ncbi:MAG: SCP2 sterol-binding domain-containing protein [Thiohalomonadaceae bacterium]
MVFPTSLLKVSATLLPAVVQGMRLVPDSVHSTVVAHITNHLLKGQWIREQLTELHGKCFALHIRDTGTELRFEVAGTRLIRAANGGHPDVTIEGNLHDFWLLASRREDPDTLFFHRRLALKGDVATGLQVKNLLDAMEYDTDAHIRAVLGDRAGAAVSGTVTRLRHLAGAIQRQP